MTTIRLALSATAPGLWTNAATRYGYIDTVGPTDIYGNPAGDRASEVLIATDAAAVALPNAASDSVYEQQVLNNLEFGGTHLQSASGLVTVTSYTNEYGLQTGAAPGYLQNIVADGPWNLIKDIAISALNAQAVTISNFVDVQLDSGSDQAAHVIDIEDAKRGSINVAGAQETVSIKYLSNEYSWSNTFNVTLGNGNNTMSIMPLDAYSAGLIQPLTPMTFNTEPQKTKLELTTGNGQNTIDARESSNAIHLGHGSNNLRMVDGHNEVWTSGGSDTIAIYAHTIGAPTVATDIGSDLLHIGSEAASVFIDDSTPAIMSQTTVEITASPTSTAISAASISYGHYAAGGWSQSGAFTQGDWSHLTFDFKGFGPGAKLALYQQPGYAHLLIQNPQSGASRLVTLSGDAIDLNRLHIVWT